MQYESARRTINQCITLAAAESPTRNMNSDQSAKVDKLKDRKKDKSMIFIFFKQTHSSSMEEQKVVVKFCTLLRKSDTEIHSDLVRAYDEIVSENSADQLLMIRH